MCYECDNTPDLPETRSPARDKESCHYSKCDRHWEELIVTIKEVIPEVRDVCVVNKDSFSAIKKQKQKTAQLFYS